ncbi:MAG TPA: Ig-like domain-containing protein [Sphingobacterium sp.]|nr:Ig-like domain-containing protein [Sphingobacterium sp.]
MTNNNFFNARKLLFAFVSLIALFLYSCGKDDPTPIEITVSVPSAIQVNVADNKATISGKADIGSEVTFQYAGINGQVLRTIKADASGNFSFAIDQLVDYEQELVAFATKDNKTSETVTLNKIPAKSAYSGGWDIAKGLMQAHRWKSDQMVSRIIIKQTATTPPYDIFATVAQKYFDFKADGAFHFEVTSPLQFTHTSGTWEMDENGVITINTVIPLGPMQISDAKIQHLDADRLTLLCNISDGLFLLNMTKE